MTTKKRANLAKATQIDRIKLADGKEYELKPLNLNIWADTEDKFGEPYFQLISSGRVKPMRYVVWLRLKDKYPELTEEG